MPRSGYSVEEPMFVVRTGRSRNPLHWIAVLVFAQIRALGVAAVVALLGQVAMQGKSRDGFVIGIVAFVLVLTWTLWRAFRVDRGTYRFFADAVDIDWQPVRGEGMRRVVPYSELSHVGLPSRDRILLRFCPSGAEAAEEVSIRIAARVGEDVFDHFVEHLEAAGADQLYSIEEHGEVRYPRSWDFAGAPEVTTARVDLRDGRVADGMQVGARRIHVRQRAGLELRDEATREKLLTLHEGRVLDPRGCVLMTVDAGSREVVRVHSGAGEELEWRRRGPEGELLAAAQGEVVGRARWADAAVDVEFAAPVHDLRAAALTLVVADDLVRANVG